MASYLQDLDVIKADLMARFPGFQVWYVPHLDRSVTWCARPNPLLNEDSPEALAEAIARIPWAASGNAAAARYENVRPLPPL